MTRSRTRAWLLPVLITLSALVARAADPVPELPAGTILGYQDFLGRNWQNELLILPVDPSLTRSAVLLRTDGQVLPQQWTQTADGRPAIAFLASVGAFASRTWTLMEPGPLPKIPPAPDWRETRADGHLEFVHLLGGLGLRLALDRETAAARGPILGLRLPGQDGRWIGGGSLTGATLTDYTLETLAAGDLYHHYRSTATLEGGAVWTVNVIVQHHANVIRIEESLSADTDAVWRLALEPGWAPTNIFWREPTAGGALHADLLGPPRQAPVFTLEPWVRWWEDLPRGNWFALYGGDPDAGDRSGRPTGTGIDALTEAAGAGAGDATLHLDVPKPGGKLAQEPLLLVGAYDAGVWRDPASKRRTPDLLLQRQDASLVLPLSGPARHWLIATGMAGPSVALKGKSGQTPPCQDWLIRHGDIPLRRVYDYTLSWGDPAAPLAYPRLFVGEADIARLRAGAADLAPLVQRLRGQEPSVYNLDDWAYAIIATGDSQLIERFRGFGLATVRGAVQLYMRQDGLPTMGTDLVRHYMRAASAINTADILLMPGILGPEDTARVRAQIAFLGYTLARPEIISPERGYAANPNMTSMTRCTLGILACLIPDHPEARAWWDLAYAEWRREVNGWSGPNGGWLEAPHYAVAALDPILAMGIASRRSGFVPADQDLALHPKLKRSAAWLAKLLGPPDPRLGGRRSQQAIGNSYPGETTCLPAWFASLWRDADPDFAAYMQYMWIAQGRPTQPAIGGFCASTAGAGRLLIDPSITPREPPWGSELFPASGAVFRAHFPSEHEMYLYYIQGPHHQHYDYDEGAIVLWGKGRPLVQEFGYYGRAPVREHSVFDDGTHRQLGWEGRIQDFAATPAADYLRGLRQDWTRQILFVKDRDPLGPNYVVLRDHLAKARPGAWRVWLPSDHDLFGRPSKQHAALPDEIRVDAAVALDGLTLDGKPKAPPHPGNPLRVIGRHAGDLGVYFLRRQPLPVTSERVTQTSGASGFTDKSLTQNSVLVQVPAGEPICAILYPLLPDDAMPTFTILDEQRAVKIQTAAGIDYVLLSEAEFELRTDDGLAFRGVSGLVQIRGATVTLTLPRGGRLAWGEHVLESAEAASRSFP